MTNVGIVHPEPEFPRRMRKLTRKYGTLLILDETHTICAAPAATHARKISNPTFWFLETDRGGVPGAAYGFTQNVASKISDGENLEDCDVGGIGGTLAGNALSLAAMRATLKKRAHQRSVRAHDPDGRTLDRWCAGNHLRIQVPWHVTRLGCRAEYLFCAKSA